MPDECRLPAPDNGWERDVTANHAATAVTDLNKALGTRTDVPEGRLVQPAKTRQNRLFLPVGNP